MSKELRFLCWPIAVGFLIASGANADSGNMCMSFACGMAVIGHIALGVLGGDL